MEKWINADAVNRALDRIREEAWLHDIPSPAVPEYIEHHDAIQLIMLVIDKERKLLNDAADVAPVRHGKWIKQSDRTKTLYGWNICSECGAVLGSAAPYCSECGAKMDGGAIGDPMEDDLR